MNTALKCAMLAAGALVASPALAQDATPTPTADTSREAGDWLFRARAIMVSPTESSGAVTGIAGSEVGVGNSVMPEVDFTYFVTKNIGAELILATTKHDVSGRGTISALGKIADTWVLPPTLTLQYHFLPEGKVHPYVGAGVNYTIFYSADATQSLNTALGATKVKLDDSFGYALQAGIDIDVTPKFFVNADIKYIDMDTTARLTTGATKRSVNVEVNPIVAGVGVGFRF
ncbi:OmpW/AlkL family protein [Sphingomonas hengshuiensis]|uniref:Membrane protein n=1 Tax=Sphingomonas hengshuiensis TaxID=1609977 RepID=A0A7U4LET4_9SPHN|nr:OmpW family protein [Sphingomonas hengshuiensis]AJP71814.1 membrane protein [Sphingomonas hengshuiensis]